MPLNKARIQQHLRDFNFRQLFVEELGWDNPPAAPQVSLGGESYALEPVAHKRGMVAFHCPVTKGGRIPDYPTRRKIEQQVLKTAHEHLIIFTDPGKTTQVWQWVKREPGKPAACREHTFNKNQSGEALMQKLQTVAFSFDEEETLTLVDVAARTRKGFDVERVTKRFYDQFKKEHASFLKFVEGIDAAADRERYASVMLNRLMFVYFVQRKGFLDGDSNYLRNRLKRCQAEKGRDKFHTFYRYFLLRLFHEGLGGKARPQELQDLLGRIPYLNGGFFEKHSIEQKYDQIHIPDKAFERIFDYFDQYQWHLDERPLRADNEINPDVLGFIFEKYINQKQMGAYYTQEDITGYMSRNTIIPFLFDAARKDPKARPFFGVEQASPPAGGTGVPPVSSACSAAAAGTPPKLAGGDACPTIWKLLQTDPDRYIYPAIKHGIKLDIHSQPPTPLKTPLPLPREIERGVDAARPNLIERRKGWNKPAPCEYALPTEIWREVVARRQRYEELRSKLAGGQVRDINDLVTLNLDMVQFAQDVLRNGDSPELLRAFWHALEKLSVLDPTVGSGAFLFAALNILKPLYEACLERMEAFVGDLDRSGGKHRPEKFSDFRAVLERVEAHPNSDYFILKSIILNNLYGVDIMHEATEICKLRLFLKLAAQVDPDPAKDNFGIEPLPDIDFNIRAGNTLVGYATAEEVRRALTSEKTTGRDQMRLGLMDEKDSFASFEENVELADRAFGLFRTMQADHGMDTREFADAKKNLRQRLRTLEDELNKCLAADYRVKTSDERAYKNWLNTHLPFHWLVEFYGIVTSGGFDVIVGNPPYVSAAKVRRTYTVRNLKTLACSDIYAWVLERVNSLLRVDGRSGMIVPLSLGFSRDFDDIRTILYSENSLNWFSSFGRIPSALFNFDVRVRNTIHLGKKSCGEKVSYTTRLHRWFDAARPILFSALEYACFQPKLWKGRIPKLNTQRLTDAFERLLEGGRATLDAATSSRATRHVLHFKKTAYNWLNFCRDLPPCYEGARRVEHTEFGDICFPERQTLDLAMLLANGKWMFAYWCAIADDFHVTRWNFADFPADITRLDATYRESLLAHVAVLEQAMVEATQFKLNAGRRVGNYNLAKCRHVTDKTDTIFAQALGVADALDDVELYCVQVVKTDFSDDE